MSSFDSFVEEVAKNEKDLTEEDKAAYEDRYQNIVNNCYQKFKKDMSLEERQEFWKSSLEYYIAKEGGSINLVLNDKENEEFAEYIGEEIEELIKESGDEFAETVQNILSSEVPKLIDTVVDEIEKLGDELKKAFEDK